MIYSKTCSQSHEREYKLCFNRWFIFFPLFYLNQLYQTKFTLSLNWVLLEKRKFFLDRECLPFTLLRHTQMRIKFLWDVMLCHWVFGSQCLKAQWSFKTVTNTRSLTVSYHRRLASSAVVLNIGLCASMDFLFFTCSTNMRDISNLVPPPHTHNFFTLYFEMIMSLTTLQSKSDIYFINWIITVCHKICNFICNSWSSSEWVLHMKLLALCI